jgi:hypothetical protein
MTGAGEVIAVAVASTVQQGLPCASGLGSHGWRQGAPLGRGVRVVRRLGELRTLAAQGAEAGGARQHCSSWCQQQLVTLETCADGRLSSRALQRGLRLLSDACTCRAGCV